jgi:hypothetical protein
VRFSAAALRGCLLDRDATVRAVEVAEGFPGALDLGAHTLSVLGDADFTGGAAASGAGRIRFPSAHPSSLSGPAGALPLPPVIHDGPGLLRLDGRALSVSGLTQSGGVFDFHGFDLVVAGAWQVKAGRPGTLRNLDGRSVIATGGARLEGVARDTALGLATSPKGWTLNASGADSLIARYAQLGNARATGKAGIAILSADAGGNQGWTFLNVPAFMVQPRDTALRTGDTAVFRVSLAAPQSAAYQWLRDDVAIPGAADSIYVLKGARKADSGAVFTCKASNPAGYAYSAPSHLKVSFPAPASDPPPAPFADSVRVRLIPSAPAAQTWFSRNGGAWTPYAAPLLLADSTVLRAYSVLLGDTSATATLAFPRALPPILPAPAIQPEGGTFAGSLTVTLVPPLAGARLYYTLDGSDPDSAAEAYAGPFTLAATATVRAIAYLQGYRPSPVAMRVYVRKGDTALPPPAAAPPGGTFADSAVVRVSPPPGFPDAALYCRLLPAAADSSPPAPVPFRCPDSLVIRAGATLEALAVSGSRASDTARWDFVRRLGSPSVTPKGRIFHDTLRIRASASAPGESVRYTLDGSDPGPASPLFPAGGILLDSSAEVRAASALGSGLGPVVSETYTLIPDTPEVSPRGGDYSSPIRVTLSSRTPRASIYYTLDGTAPGPDRGLPPYSGPFDLDTNATLKAVAVVGAGGRARSGALRIENYAFILTGNRTLQPGRRLALSGNYSLGSPADAATEVSVEVLAADSVSAGLRGFRGVLFGLRLSLPLGAAGFPPLTLACPAGEPRALYRLAAPGIVRWVASAGGGPIDAAGTYFLAEDTLAPTVRYSGESFTSEDSTRLVVTIEDNVQNLGLDLERSDDPGRSFAGHEVNPVLILAVNAKNPPGDLRPLTVKIKVDDHTRSASFPADGGAYALQQRFPGPVSSPAAYRIGTDPEAPWDLVALPLAADQPLTLAKLRKDNSAPGLQAAVFDPKREAYVFPAADAPLEPGTSFWLAAPASLSALALSGARTVSLKGRTVPGLILHPGWNQVANPTLSPLWWPADRSDSESYQASPVKGLHAWDAVAGGYVHAEVLEPWRGYFAYYHGDRDTAIDLLGAPPSPPADSVLFGSLGKAGAAGPGFRLRLSWSAGGILRLGASPRAAGGILRLGASPRAADGFGVEDEAGPPARDPASTRLFSARRGLRLETDLERWRPGFVYAWTVVAGLSPRGSGALSAAAEGLPPGYAAWAVSRARGLRFPLSDGSGEASPLPWRPGYADTLDVLAGPAAALESRLAAIPLRPGPFAARACRNPAVTSWNWICPPPRAFPSPSIPSTAALWNGAPFSCRKAATACPAGADGPMACIYWYCPREARGRIPGFPRVRS